MNMLHRLLQGLIRFYHAGRAGLLRDPNIVLFERTAEQLAEGEGAV
jgi:hypothetical protein